MDTHVRPDAPARVAIFDTSLRDGEQSPGCSMTAAQKLRFAHALAELGVDTIEAGFPASSESDLNGCAAIARDVRGAGVATLARCNSSDIEACARALERAERPRIHVFISTSPLHREHKLAMSRDEVVARAVAGVEQARRYVEDVEFSAEDALRTEPDFLAEICSAALEAGARTLNIPDTVGYTTPAEIRALFEYLRANVRDADRAIFSAHCHDDLGLAVANSLAAIEGGARQVECTINGIGERAGNCALEELVMALETRRAYFGATTGIRTERLVPTSRLLTRITGMGVQRNKAIVGANAFAHESGIHQHGMLKHRGTYEILRPEAVGWAKSQMIMGRHSGRAALADRLKELGFALEEPQLNQVFGRFKALTEKKREVFDADLEALALGIDCGTGNGIAIGGWRLHRLHVSTGVGDGTLPTASVELSSPDGRRVTEAATGDGPVHALFAALARGTGTHLDVESYQVSSVTTGEDAQGQASLTARAPTGAGGDEITGSGTSTDILEASALAWLDIVNRLHRRRIPGTTDAAAHSDAITAPQHAPAPLIATA